MARRRVLVQPHLIEHAFELNSKGVPITKILRDYNIDNLISRPAFNKLLAYYKLYLKADANKQDQASMAIYYSLFPLWLTMEDNLIVQQPFDYKYEGLFPTGEWVKEKWI